MGSREDRAWIPRPATPIADVVVHEGAASDLVDRLLVASGSVPARFHWRAHAKTPANRLRIDLWTEESCVQLKARDRDALRIPWDGSRSAYDNVTSALTSLICAYVPKSVPIAPERRFLALAIVDAFGSAQSTFGPGSRSAYLFGARHNITAGDDASIDPNLRVVAKDLERTVPDWKARAEVRRHLKVALRSRLAGATPEQIRATAELLAPLVDGDADEITHRWREDDF